MHQGGGVATFAPAAVVLRQGEGGTGDRLADAQLLGQALHQAGLAGPQITPQQQQRGMVDAACLEQRLRQAPSQGSRGGGIVERLANGLAAWEGGSGAGGCRHGWSSALLRMLSGGCTAGSGRAGSVALCRLTVSRARSLGDSAVFSVHFSPDREL